MKHVAIYCRVSTKDQDTASQEPDLERWAELNADGRQVQWYRDKFTGRTMERPGWNQIELGLLNKEVTQIVVWRLDRLGRTASGMTKLFDELIALKIPLVSIKENIDLSTPAGRLMANVIASFAQWETECRSERVKAGIERARKAGKTWGGSPKGRRSKLTDAKLEVIQQMHADGKGVTTIADTVGLSRWYIYRLLKSA